MTQKHTPEPWYVFSHYGDPEIRTKDSDKLVSAMLPSKIYDARRIVACVNACAGISNVDLEMDNAAFINTFNERTEYKKRCEALQNQRDDLLAALEKVIDASISPKACRIAQDAIASVKGGAA